MRWANVRAQFKRSAVSDDDLFTREDEQAVLAPVAMSSKLPPPDPFETLGWAPSENVPMRSPAAVYIGGPPTPEGKRISSVILDLRPGALFVVAPS